MAGFELPLVHEGHVPRDHLRYERMRDERERRYAGSEPKSKRRAVQTIVHNEPVFFPIWLAYYSRFFGPEDIYVLDNGTTDGTTDGDGFVRIPVARDAVDHAWMADQLSGHQAELLERYDAVVTTDVDEIVAPVPGDLDLGSYLDRLDEEWVNCRGFEVLHMHDREPPFRRDLPVLGQRGYWFANPGYDKPAVATEHTPWVPGLHAREDKRKNLDPDLYLIHLHRMDFGICRDRHLLRTRRGWNDEDLERGWGRHNRVVAEEDFERWFYEDSCFEVLGVEIVVEPIPPPWRGVF